VKLVGNFSGLGSAYLTKHRLVDDLDESCDVHFVLVAVAFEEPLEPLEAGGVYLVDVSSHRKSRKIHEIFMGKILALLLSILAP